MIYYVKAFIKLYCFAILSLFIYSCTEKEAKTADEKNEQIEIPNPYFGKEITFTEHIAPIVHSNCSPCHHENGPAPFQLIHYFDLKKRASTIRKVVEMRYMPPWPADTSYSHFIGERVLSLEQIQLIAAWHQGGSLPGDTSKLINLPNFKEETELGKPDLFVKIPKAYSIKKGDHETFLLAKVPVELEKETYVAAIEFVPGVNKLVHHMNGHYLAYPKNSTKNIFKGNFYANPEESGYEDCYKQLDLANADGTFPALVPSVTNYLPGVMPVIYPAGIGGYTFQKKGILLMRDIHYGPAPIDISDQSGFNIYYSKTAPERPTQEFQLGTLGVSPIVPELIIPADTIMKFTSTYVIPEKMSILTINPHMHYLGKSFWGFAIKPNGDTIPMIKINKWDFRWQYFYTFKKPIVLEAGSKIIAVGIFDNTKNNPVNPFSPPRIAFEPVGLNMKSTDEMFQFIITYVPYKVGDEELDLDVNRKKK